MNPVGDAARPTSPAPSNGRFDGTLQAVAAEWDRARRSLARALPAVDLDALGTAFVAGVEARLSTPTRWLDPPDSSGVASKVRQGAAALELLALAGYPDRDLLVAALLLPWCDPALGGSRVYAAERPRMTGWSDAVLFATLSAEPRPGQGPLGARHEHLRHVASMPPEVRAVVAASWRAALGVGPGSAAQRHRELVTDVTALLHGLPAEFREAVVRPPTLLGWLSSALPAAGTGETTIGDADPITHPDTAIQVALASGRGIGPGPITIEEYDVGYLLWPAPGAALAVDPPWLASGAAPASGPVWPPGPPPAPDANWSPPPVTNWPPPPGTNGPPAPGAPPPPGSRVPALIVDRQTRVVTDWYELSPDHALHAYAARHRLFPLVPGWRVGERGDLAEGLGADLAQRFGAEVAGQLAVVGEHLAEEYRHGLGYGDGWPGFGDRWDVGVAAVDRLLRAELADPDVLAAALLGPHLVGGHEPTIRAHLAVLSPAAARLLDSARPPVATADGSAADAFEAYVDRLTGAEREVRAVAVALALAGAGHALTRFGGVCHLRRAELGKARRLSTDLPVLDAELSAWAVGETP